MYPTLFFSNVVNCVLGAIKPAQTFHDMDVNSVISPIFAAMRLNILLAAFFSIVWGWAPVQSHAFTPPGHTPERGTGKHGEAKAQNGGHEFYVGLTDMVYNPATRRYEVTIKVFTDDLELGISGSLGEKLSLSGTDPSSHHAEAIFTYIATRLSVKEKGGKAMVLYPVGAETELDVTWIYLESDPMQPLRSAVVSNTMMMEVYEDQTHIFHITQNDRTRSTLLNQKRQSDSISL